MTRGSPDFGPYLPNGIQEVSFNFSFEFVAFINGGFRGGKRALSNALPPLAWFPLLAIQFRYGRADGLLAFCLEAVEAGE